MALIFLLSTLIAILFFIIAFTQSTHVSAITYYAALLILLIISLKQSKNINKSQMATAFAAFSPIGLLTLFILQNSLSIEFVLLFVIPFGFCLLVFFGIMKLRSR